MTLQNNDNGTRVIIIIITVIDNNRFVVMLYYYYPLPSAVHVSYYYIQSIFPGENKY